MLNVLKWSASWLSVSLPLHNSVTFDTRALSTAASTVGKIQSSGGSEIHLMFASLHAVRKSFPKWPAISNSDLNSPLSGRFWMCAQRRMSNVSIATAMLSAPSFCTTFSIVIARASSMMSLAACTIFKETLPQAATSCTVTYMLIPFTKSFSLAESIALTTAPRQYGAPLGPK